MVHVELAAQAVAAGAMLCCTGLMKISVHCCCVSLGLVTLWPFVFGDMKISWSLPPCMQGCIIEHRRARMS